MFDEDYTKLKAKKICFGCVAERYLSDEIRSKGKRAQCSYCQKLRRSYDIGDVAERIEVAFDQHYIRTSDQPNDFQHMMLRDRESSYEWERDGEPVIDAIMNAADIPQEAAEDIQKILEDEHSDFDSAAMGEETPFADSSCYEQKGPNGDAWRDDWDSFERSLKTEARFFSRRAVEHLASVFDGLDGMRTRDGSHLVVDAGPETEFHTIFRARAFQANDKLEAALCRPDTQLGSPPSFFASAGRMNARGISVFYGASDAKVAIAEVRPPVGSQVAVAQFSIIRKLRLLNLEALQSVDVSGSIFDPEFAEQTERASFLRTLSSRMTRPVMPDDEPFEYLATQAIADFLATESSAPIDGIVYPSVQATNGALNIVLFHKAARVELLDVPKGTDISARTGQLGEDDWEDEYVVIERVPPGLEKAKKEEEKSSAFPSTFAELARGTMMPWEEPDGDWREASLRIVTESVKVHQIVRVAFETEEFEVRRYRWEKHDSDF